MYESLASVFKAFSSTFNNLHLDFVIEYNKRQSLDGEAVHFLDPLTINFQLSINNLLANGPLTRSRRAVLINWKVVFVYALYVSNLQHSLCFFGLFGLLFL